MDTPVAALVVGLLLRLAMIASLVVVALSVAYTALENRRSFAELEQLRTEEVAIDMQWSRLLLEKGALLSPVQLQRIAIQEMGMHKPAVESVVVVAQ